ncbi:hypothetical protein PIB30_036311 [Stylosanthes scabra]|uniref:Non-haem dioxygenase N-terminal domain-containing protein n=1 Tax=Stylosanthes scabra TaxID=79078 RepID=A0ABU6SE21_9FABA|nr:hypothetical protein [Stylosanthes scabra]
MPNLPYVGPRSTHGQNPPQNSHKGPTISIIRSTRDPDHIYTDLVRIYLLNNRSHHGYIKRRSALLQPSSLAPPVTPEVPKPLKLGRRVKSRTRETVIPEPDYRIPIVLLGIASGLAYTENLVAAVPVGLLGILLLVQTTRVKFVFDDEALEIRIGDQLEELGENVFVGGKNRWKYSTFVNWAYNGHNTYYAEENHEAAKKSLEKAAEHVRCVEEDLTKARGFLCNCAVCSGGCEWTSFVHMEAVLAILLATFTGFRAMMFVACVVSEISNWSRTSSVGGELNQELEEEGVAAKDLETQRLIKMALSSCEAHILNSYSASDDEIPTVDYSLLFSDDPAQRSVALEFLRHACEEFGFFYLVNHTIPETVLDGILKEISNYFDPITLNERKVYRKKGALDTIRWDQNFTSDENREYLKLFSHPQFHAPSNASAFSKIVEKYSEEMRKVVGGLAKAISNTLGV